MPRTKESGTEPIWGVKLERGVVAYWQDQPIRSREMAEDALEAIERMVGETGEVAYIFRTLGSERPGQSDFTKVVDTRPDGWPERCGACGAAWTEIRWDIVDGFCCLSCGGCDSDE